MKKIFMLSLLGLLMGCQSQQWNSDGNQGRHPSSANAMSRIQACGRIEFPESNQTARDGDDLNYAIHLDCNGDKHITKEDGHKLLMIPPYSINNENRQWLVQQRHALVERTQNSRANPYVCLSVKVSADPCSQSKTVWGFSPIFSQVK